MTTLCDMRLASDRARFGEVAVPAGFVPESGGSRNLPKLVGIGRAMRLILTGEIIDAQEALRIGLVDEVVPHEELMEQAFSLAGKIAANPYLSVAPQRAADQMYWQLATGDRRDRAIARAGGVRSRRSTSTKDCQKACGRSRKASRPTTHIP
ncbi:Short-chain-enoyl-CoA hydratase (Fragment) [Geodia barretti]